MALLTEQIVGRADELGSLEDELAELGKGRAAVVELVGEPGIGKTRLLAELAARAAARGYLVLSGSASELERDLPFWVFVDALDEYVQALEPRRLNLLDEDVRAELAHVFPALATQASDGAKSAQHERYRTHRAVRALLELLAATKPFVLELDDLHWADSGSIELVGALLRRPPTAPVLIALAIRPRQVPERLSAALDRAHREGRIARLELGALTAGETRELLGDTVEGAVATALYEESGGNPFYLEQLARSAGRGLQPRPATSEPSLAELEVPPMVAAALTEELALLSDGTRSVLEGAAVAGDPFEPELAAAAAAVTGVTAMDALDELVQLDLIRATDVPRRFRFRHPLVRRAVYEATRSGWRLGAHERCAEALAATGATASARAHHVERSAREGDAGAAAVLREAGEEAAPRAPATAARWFAAASRLLPQSAPAKERVELLLARSGALTTSGQFADSHGALVDALEIAPDDAHEIRARLTRACAAAEHLLGRNEHARRRLANALQSLPDPRSPESVSLLIELALNGFWRMSHEEMHEAAERAVTIARALQDAPLTAAALGALALADSMTGKAERAEAERVETAALVDSLTDDELARRLDAATWLAAAELYSDRYAEADTHADRAMAVGRATGQGETFLILTQILGTAWRVRGKLAEAAELLDRGI
ncbi:MAG TPA: BREX system ATP-binding domain-containing protein, partial [Gaiellaceae bacterium]|nr:BREX system ATP-binding domain-containing protein [Gaiellaceae bacterium]